MPLDVDYIFAMQAIKELEEILRNVEHGEREQIADEIGGFVDNIKNKYCNVSKDE